MKWLIDTRADIPTELNPAYIKAKNNNPITIIL